MSERASPPDLGLNLNVGNADTLNGVCGFGDRLRAPNPLQGEGGATGMDAGGGEKQDEGMDAREPFNYDRSKGVGGAARPTRSRRLNLSHGIHTFG